MDLRPFFQSEKSQGSFVPDQSPTNVSSGRCDLQVEERFLIWGVPWCARNPGRTRAALPYRGATSHSTWCALLDPCPPCNQSVSEFARASSFSASTLFHVCIINVDRPPLNRGLNSVVLPSFPPSREWPVFLCCPRLGPFPHFDPSNDRRMDGCVSVATGQWADSRTTLHPVLDSVHCGGGSCQFRVLVVVFEVPPSDWGYTIRSHSTSPPVSVTVPVTSRDWFTQGPLRQMGLLCGRRDSPIRVPGSGTQAWLLCQVISLALAGAERARHVALYSTGPRQPAPTEQEGFWTSIAEAVINCLATHFQSLSSQSSVALEL